MKSKLKLASMDEQELVDHAEAVRAILGDYAHGLALSTAKSEASALAILFRPYLLDTYAAPDAKEAKEAAQLDQRERQWDVRCYIWKVWEGEDTADELLADNESSDRVRGLNGVGDLVREYIGMHDINADEVQGLGSVERPFTTVELRRRMGSLRPAINRGGGACASRWSYVINGQHYMFQIDIARVNKKT